MDLVVTTVHKPSPQAEISAASLANKLGVALVERGKTSLQTIRDTYNVSNILVVSKHGPLVNTPGGDYFFHLNMAELRINNLINGKHDHMVTAMGLTEGSTVLDCTLGLATDAIVAGFVAGNTGKVTGTEVSPVIAAIAEIGLQHFESDNADITAALRRIKVVNVDYLSYLNSLPAKCIDIVYFDPMFRTPVYSSSNLKPLRFLADNSPLSLDAIQAAKRVAKRRVVIKEANGSSEFTRLKVTAIMGGKYSSVQYGVIETGD
jgi:hypothetical protein